MGGGVVGDVHHNSLAAPADPEVGGGPPFERRGTRVLERIDESVTTVEDLLARSPSASSA